jgi:hypothetical protein
VTPGSKSVPTPRSEAKLYVAKATQFAEEAREAVSASRNDAALLNAVHAAISATDSVCVALAGRRSSDTNHQRAADLLEEIGGDSPALRASLKQLRMLLARKNVVEYESRRSTAREAVEAVKRAERLVAWATEIVNDAPV